MKDKRQEIRDWLQTEINRKGHGAKGKLAENLGIRPEGISRMLNDEPGKEAREISAVELLKMMEFFGSTPPVKLTSYSIPKATGEDQIRKLLSHIEGISDEHVEILTSVALSYLPAAARYEQTQDGDQPSSATRRREELPSR